MSARAEPAAKSRTGIIGVAAALIGGLAVVFVGFSLYRPEPPTFDPSAVNPRPVGECLVGPSVYTVDASDGDRWRYFSFSKGSVIEGPGPFEWDLAFRRFRIIANGGEAFPGTGGIVDLGEIPLDSVTVLPEEGYEPTEAGRDSVNAAIDDWYNYSFLTHLLSPRPRTYAVRTADGRYAALEILSYYCTGAVPGCLTFRYVYQGAGGPALRPR